MRHIGKQALSLLLALLLCLGFSPAALAEEGMIRPAEDGEESGLSGTPAPTEEDETGNQVGDGVLDVPSNNLEEPAADEAQETVDSGRCGANLTWTLDDAGVLTISGTGDMYDYSYGNWGSHVRAPWLSNNNAVKEVMINSGVTYIGEYAFHWGSSIASVIIPSSVESIGINAFANCRSLTSVKIPEGVTCIEERAFESCTSLESMTIPASVTHIGYDAFYGCSSLKAVYIHDATAWSQIKFVGGVYSNPLYYAHDLYLDEQLVTNLVTLSGVTSIGDNVFAYCKSLRSVTIPAGVTSIGMSAFSNCINLESISLPSSVSIIGESAFGYCSMTNVTIPASVTSIQDHAFFGCSKLKEIHFTGNAPMIGTGAFFEDTATAYYPADDPSWTEDVRQDYGGSITWVPWEPSAALSGDVNGDGTVDDADLIRLRKYLVGLPETEIVEANAKVNGDDVIDILDLVRLRKYLAGVPGTEIVEANANVNGDGIIDILDLVRLRKYFAGENVPLE